MFDPKQHFVDLREALTELCFQGQTHYRIWRAVNESFSTHPTPAENAPVFFVLTAKAHFNASFSYLAKLVDKHKDSVKINDYIQFARSHPYIFQKEQSSTILKAVEEDSKLIETFSDHIINIRAWRDKYYSHLDRELISKPKAIFELYPIKPIDIYRLFEQIGNIINRYSGYYDDSSRQMGIIGEDDVTWLIEFIEQKLKVDS